MSWESLFKEWPFAEVPSRERGARLWADRKPAAKQVEAILDTWANSPGSTINLLWADLGAGKTHTLYYLESRCIQNAKLVPLYVLLPATIKKFEELYAAIANVIDWREVSRSLQGTTRSARMLKRVLQWYESELDSHRSALADRWLQAEKLTAKQCEILGVGGYIDSTEEAVGVLTAAVSALSSGPKRVVLMIDEYQRVAEGNRRQLQNIGHAIHTLYNACPTYFSLLLSCAMGTFADYAMVLTPEIVSRLSLERIDLPYLSDSDVIDYIRDLFAFYRNPGEYGDPFFPLTLDLTKTITEFVQSEVSKQLTPRVLNDVFDDCLSNARRQKERIPLSARYVDNWKPDARERLRKKLQTS